MKDAYVLKTPFQKQRLTSSWFPYFTYTSMHVTADANFCEGPRMR